MIHEGVLIKMQTEIGYPIQYTLHLNKPVAMNELIGTEIQLSFIGYQCLGCQKKKKTFRQGMCYDCFYASPMVGDWVIRPELSKAHLDEEDRDLEYEKKSQLQPHVVYLALSSEVKVGVTRKSQVPTRWIDQGANAALPIVETPNRYLAGITEVALKEHLSDKTNWRKMLTNNVEEVDLMEVLEAVEQYVPDETQDYIHGFEEEVVDLDYPVTQYPEKVKSLNLAKAETYQGKLVGIKGQYLIFEDNTVFNVRSNEGTVVELRMF